MSIAYKSKQNERLIGQPIVAEPHTIGIVGVFTVSSGNIRLIEVPQGPAPAVFIPGYNEIITGSPTGVQFIVNYETGVITFNASENGNVVSASYTGLGSEIAAEDINELQIPVGIALNADGSLSAGIVTTASISGSAVIPLTNLQTLNNSIVPITSGSGVLISSATTATELGYVHGVTSDIQTQLNNLSAGTITSVVGTTNEITASTVSGAVTLSLPSTVDITTLNLTNPLAVASGGTGLAALTAHDVLVGNGTSNVTLVSPNTAGYVLTSNGTSADPTFQAIPASTGITALTGDVTTSVSPSNPYLNTAAAYAVLAKTAVTNTGSTVLTGNLGISPNNATSITGFPPGTYSGTENAGNAAAATALADATSAATTLQAMGPGTDVSATDFGGHMFTPGVYSTSSIVTWSAGDLTLNGAGTYVFLVGTSLTMPASANVVLTGGAIADNVYFVTGTTFIFGANCTVNGTILAGTAITFAASSVLNGRALCYGSAGTSVTFPSAATVTIPPGSGGVEVATLATVNSDIGTYNWSNVTVNGKGLVTAVSSNAIPVTSITGTANEVIASSSTGAVTLSLPQAIATTSSPTFAGETITGDSIILGSASGPSDSIGIYIGSGSGPSLVYDKSVGSHQWEFLNAGSNRYLIVSESSNTLGVNLGSGSPQATVDVAGTVWIHGTNALYFGNINSLYTAIQASASISSPYALILPAAQGAANTSLQNDGSGNLNFSNVYVMNNEASAPGSPALGQIYFNTGDTHFYGWNGSAWKQLDN